MQNSLLALLIGGAIIFPASGHAETSYVKLGVGQSHYSGDPSSRPTGYYLAYGSQIDSSLDLEVGYVDFGRASIGPAFEDVATGRIRFKTWSVYGAGIANIPMSPTVTLQGKLGIAVNRSSAVSASDDLLLQDYQESPAHTNVRGLVGAGLKMQFTREVFGAVEYTYFGTAAHGYKLSLMNAVVGYQF